VGSLQERFLDYAYLFRDTSNSASQVEAELRHGQIIAASSSRELRSDGANRLGQETFYGRVNVLVAGIQRRGLERQLFLHLVQTSFDRLNLGRFELTRRAQRTGVDSVDENILWC
jgi:hypothetical protein